MRLINDDARYAQLSCLPSFHNMRACSAKAPANVVEDRYEAQTLPPCASRLAPVRGSGCGRHLEIGVLNLVVKATAEPSGKSVSLCRSCSGLELMRQGVVFHFGSRFGLSKLQILQYMCRLENRGQSQARYSMHHDPPGDIDHPKGHATEDEGQVLPM